MYWFSAIGQRIAWIVFKPFLHFFIHLRIIGKKNVKKLKEPVIYAVNHVSELDGPILPAGFNFFSSQLPIIFVSLERKYYKDKHLPPIFYNSFFFRFLGVYPAVTGIKNYEKSLTTHIDFLRKGVSVAIFLEGKRMPDAGIHKAKGGVVALARQTGCSVIPVAVSGHYRTTFKDFFLRKKYSILSFGKPISNKELFDGYENIKYSDYKEIAMKKIVIKIGGLLDGHMNERELRKARKNL